MCSLISAAQEWKVVRFLGQSLLHQRDVTRHPESTGELNHIEALARSVVITPSHFSFCLSVYVCLSVCLFVSVCFFVCLSVCLSVSLSDTDTDTSRELSLSVCVCVCLPACLPVCLPACLPVSLSLSVCLICTIFSTDAIMSLRLQGGTSTRTFEREVPDLPKRNQDGAATPQQTTSVDGAVMVTCTEEDGKVVVRSTSAGYNSRTTSFFSYTEHYCMRNVMTVHFRKSKLTVANTTCGFSVRFVGICAEPLIFTICCACLLRHPISSGFKRFFISPGNDVPIQHIAIWLCHFLNITANSCHVKQFFLFLSRKTCSGAIILKKMYDEMHGNATYTTTLC